MTKGLCLLLMYGGACTLLAATPALAQGAKKAPVATNAKSLDQQAEKAQNEYLASLADLATKYEEVGDLQKSSDMLKSILKIKPDADAIRTRLKQFEESVFKDNSHTVEVDSAGGWISAGVMVTKEKPVRLEAEGSYKFIASDILTPAGYPTADPLKDMYDGAPCGALIAFVAKSAGGGDSGGRQRGGQKEAPHAVMVGAHSELNPSDSGTLYLKLNVPDGSKCTGKIKVKITGNILPVR